VAHVAGLPPDSVRRAAEALIGAGVLEPHLPLDFAHPIVRTVVADAVPLADRPALNARAAAALARQGADVERVAARLVHVPAGTPLPLGDAAALLTRAAESALDRGAPAAALTFARRGLAEGGDRGALDLLAARAEALQHAPGWEERWAGAVADIDDPATRDAAVLEVVNVLTSLGEWERATAMARAARPSDPALGAALRAASLNPGLLHAAHAEATAPAVRALIDRELAGEPLELLERALVAFALQLWGVDGPRAAALAHELLGPDLFAGGNPSLLHMTLTTLIFTDSHATAVTAFDGLSAHAERTGSHAAAIGGASGRGLARYLAGDLLDAETDAETVMALMSETAQAGYDPFQLTTVVHVLIERGRAQEALALLEVHSAPEPWPPAYQFAFLLNARAAAKLVADDGAGALEDALAAGAIAERLGCGPVPEWRITAAHAHLRLGSPGAAAALAQAQLDAARRAGLPRPIGAALGALGLARADLELLGQAVSVLEDGGARLELLRARLFHGGALRRANQRNAAVTVLQGALTDARRQGATLLAGAIAAELRVAGARPRRALADGVEALTAAERRVIDAAITGKTNREIAQTLFLTQKTVETHLSNAYRKLDIASRAQLAAALQT
jgi:DNA-binding CsgD family transcriptional regulator